MYPQIKQIPTILQDNIANREIERANSKTANGLVKVPLSKITIREGFNVREEFDDIEELAASIESEGLRDPLRVDILKDGTVTLLDGERRYRALLLVCSKNKELAEKFSEVRVLLNEKNLSETDRLVAMMTTQGQKPFNALEEMNGYLRLLNGWMGEPPLTITQIATRVGKAPSYIEQRLLLNKASEEEKEMIRSNKISPTAAQALIRQESDPVVRQERIKGANAKGKKLKVKDVNSAPAVKIAEEISDDIKVILKAYDFTDKGELKNKLLDISSKALAIKQIIE